MSRSIKTWLAAIVTSVFPCSELVAGTPYTEPFETLNLGQLDGQGGWHGWAANNTPFADVVNTQAHAGTKSAEVRAGADSVTEFTGTTSGQWTISTWTLATTGFIGKTYFIVMNTYADLGPWQWSVQVGFNGDTGQVECDCGSTTPAQTALVVGTWTELSIDVDLDTGTTELSYDGIVLATYQWENGVFGQDSFATRSIDAIDLYPDNVTFPSVAPFYFDDISIEPAGQPDPGTPICFGDGSGAPCGCANESNPGSMSGCLNSVSIGGTGAILSSCGAADVTAPALLLDASGVRTQPGLFFQGNNTTAGGSGLTFGDGVRCCGGAVLRLQIIDPPAGLEPVSVTHLVSSTPAGVTPGDKRCYQYWYRDPGGPCGSNFNLSSAETITWTVGGGTSCSSGHSCPAPLPAGCVITCPTGVVVTHESTVTGTGNGTSYGEVFRYTFVPAADYCIEVREVVTTAAGSDGCNCNLPGAFTLGVTLDCDTGAITDTITNVVTNNTPCGCSSVSTQKLECRTRGSSGAWTTFHTNELKWERLANGNIRATVTPMGGAAVSGIQPGPACP